MFWEGREVQCFHTAIYKYAHNLCSVSGRTTAERMTPDCTIAGCILAGLPSKCSSDVFRRYQSILHFWLGDQLVRATQHACFFWDRHGSLSNAWYMRLSAFGGEGHAMNHPPCAQSLVLQRRAAQYLSITELPAESLGELGLPIHQFSWRVWCTGPSNLAW